MGKRIGFILVIILMITLSACELDPSPTGQSDAPAADNADYATLIALATQVNQPHDVVPFPTEMPTTDSDSGMPAFPTTTPLPGEIVVTGILEKPGNSILVTWEVAGESPSGFRVLWTDQQGLPTFPESNSIQVVSPTARSAMITVTPGTIYYLRVCRFLYDKCDLYSNLEIFAIIPPTPTPDQRPLQTATAAAVQKTATAAYSSGSSGGTTNVTGTPTDPTLTITLMKGGEDGKAYMAWTDKIGSPLGYRIIYSKTVTTPTYGASGTYYYVVSDSKARFAYVDGNSNTKYYYRICRKTSTGCSSYSATYTYTFPVYSSSATATSDPASITIDDITDTVTGSAQVNWTATGSFPNGFKILYSKTTALPTLSDNITVVSDGALRVGTINGDPSTLYHVRVCKYYGGACTVYSPVFDFTFADDPAEITITGVKANGTAGTIDLTWTATGTFTNGFKLLYSTDSTPTVSNSSMVLVSNGAATSGSITASANTKYYLRVCKYTGSTCGVYSTNIVEFTTAATGIVLANSDAANYTWTLTPDTDNEDGYQIFWEMSALTPVWEDALDSQNSVDKTDRAMLLTSPPSASGSYIVRMCFLTGTECASYSNTLEVVIP